MKAPNCSSITFSLIQCYLSSPDQHGLAKTSPLELTIYLLINQTALQILEFLSQISQTSFRFFYFSNNLVSKNRLKYIMSESRSLSPEKYQF